MLGRDTLGTSLPLSPVASMSWSLGCGRDMAQPHVSQSPCLGTLMGAGIVEPENCTCKYSWEITQSFLPYSHELQNNKRIEKSPSTRAQPTRIQPEKDSTGYMVYLCSNPKSSQYSRTNGHTPSQYNSVNCGYQYKSNTQPL